MTTAPNIEMIASSLRHCSLNGGGGSGRRRGGGRRRAGGEGGDDSEGVTVELNSDVALPFHWEQCLDIRTGQVYYINWEDGTRTTVDPRTASAFSSSPTPRSTSSASGRRARRVSTPSSSGYTSVSSAGGAWRGAVAVAGTDSGYDNDDEEEDDEDEDDEEEDGEEEEEEAESSSTASSSSSSTGSSRGSAVSSTLSSFSPTDESGSGDNGAGGGLAAAGHVLVAAGCRACFMYFMVPKRADVCPKCGSSGLLHLSRNGYA
ncbi:unnamed protein product [Urochloa humidicola]